MDLSNEYIPVQMKFDFVTARGESYLSGEWIDSEINMRQCEEFEGWLEVTCSQSSNNKVSMNLDFDINIESNLKCGPVASRTKCHVYGLFWTIGAKRCKFFFAFENKAIYDVYIAYLEKTLQALEMDRNISFTDHGDADVQLKPAVSMEIVVELGNVTKDMSPIPVIEDSGVLMESVRVSDASGIVHEVQLRKSNQKSNRRMSRPIAIIGDLLSVKRDNRLSKNVPDTSLRNSVLSIHDFEIPKPKPKPLKVKKSRWNRKRNEKYLGSWMTKSNLSVENKIETDESDVDVDGGFGAFVGVNSFSKIFDSKNVTYDDKKPIEVEGNNECSFASASVNGPSLYGANVSSEQIHCNSCNGTDHRRSPVDISASPMTFSTFGKVAKVDENGYAIMRPIIFGESVDGNDYLKTGSFHATYIAIYGDVSSKRNRGVPAKAPGRKSSFDRTSSGFGSDNEIQLTGISPNKPRFSDTYFADDTVSLKSDSLSLSPMEFEDSHLDSSDRCPSPKDEFNLRTPYPIKNESIVFKPRFDTAISRHMLGHTDIRRPNIIKPDPPIVPYVKDMLDESGKLEIPCIVHDIHNDDAAESVHQKKSATKKIWNNIRSKLTSKRKGIQQKWTDIREMTDSLISLPRAMLNFA